MGPPVRVGAISDPAIIVGRLGGTTGATSGSIWWHDVWVAPDSASMTHVHVLGPSFCAGSGVELL